MTERLVPYPDRDSAPWWAALAEHRLVQQRCDDCGRWRWPPRAICGGCASFAWSWQPVPGTGEVVSWITTHHAFLPGFEAPYHTVFVRLTVASDTVPGTAEVSDTVASDTVPGTAEMSDTVASDTVPGTAEVSETVASDTVPGTAEVSETTGDRVRGDIVMPGTWFGAGPPAMGMVVRAHFDDIDTDDGRVTLLGWRPAEEA